MKVSKSAGIFRPFEDLKALLESHSTPLKSEVPAAAKPAANPERHPETDIDIFYQAMADVKQIPRDNCVAIDDRPPKLDLPHIDGDTDILAALKDLVNKGTGFVVADTPEYNEGCGRDAHPAITRRLHRGDYSVQDYIDLHGLNVADAQRTFEEFMQHNIRAGKRVVLIIHGRGLSSPYEPVLKTQVHRWLSSGYWRKWVMAFSSARWCDGGAGSTYVLFRQRPATKQIQKKRRAERDLKP
jgi:DNA-nicking Smr family endonuclease